MKSHVPFRTAILLIFRPTVENTHNMHNSIVCDDEMENRIALFVLSVVFPHLIKHRDDRARRSRCYCFFFSFLFQILRII